MYANNTTSLFDSDQLGTERIRTTVSGTVDETCTSLPGACPERSRRGDNQSCTSGEPLGRFAGHERDNEYGLAHAPPRYYSPTLGRFMTPDPLDGSPASGNPVAPSAGPGYSPSPIWPGAAQMRARAVADPQVWDAYDYTTDDPATLTDPAGLCGSGDPFLPGGGGCDPFFDPSCGCGPDNFGPFCAGCDPLTGICQPGLLKGPLPLALIAVTTLRSLTDPAECSRQNSRNDANCNKCCAKAAVVDASICVAAGILDPALGAACAEVATVTAGQCLECCRQVTHHPAGTKCSPPSEALGLAGRRPVRPPARPGG
jgi:RHS repeat-associated protein